MKYKDWLNEWLEYYVKPTTKTRTYCKYRQVAQDRLLPSLVSGDGFVYECNNVSNAYKLVAYEGNAEAVVIPEGCMSIGENAFKDNTVVKNLTIPNSVTSIGNGAFYNCRSLEEITIPFVGRSETATGYQAVFGYIFGYTKSSSSSTISGATYQYYDSTSTSSYKNVE